MRKKKNDSGIAQAVQRAGGQEKFGELLGVSQQAVSAWVRRGYVPAGRVVEIEAQFGVPRHELIDPRLRDLVDVREVGL